jgi:hypothetical protein
MSRGYSYLTITTGQLVSKILKTSCLQVSHPPCHAGILLIAAGGKGSILITSRDRTIGRLGKLIPLPPMTDDEGLELLMGKFYGEETDPDRREALDVVKKLGHLPLAIN